MTIANIINNTLNVTLGDTPSFACLEYDSCPHINRQELHDIYHNDSHESLITIREKRNASFREHIRQVILEIEVNITCKLILNKKIAKLHLV